MSDYIIEGKINISSLLAAYEQFTSAHRVAKSDLEKAGTIQYFELTFELCWKMLKRVLHYRGKNINSPRNVFREAALEKLIDSPEPWFGFLVDRNNTVHIYNKTKADEIYSQLELFKSQAAILINNLKELKTDETTN